MGLIYTDVIVESLHGNAGAIDSPFLVDTGAVDSLMPAERLHEVGIEPESTDFYELADGRLLELPVGWARLRFMGTVAIAKMVFGPEGTEPILGVIALETAGVSLDPLTNTLKRLAKRSLKRSALRSNTGQWITGLIGPPRRGTRAVDRRASRSAAGSSAGPPPLPDPGSDRRWTR